MKATDAILRSVLEAAEDDFDIKDVSRPEPEAGPTKVKRHGRYKIVDMQDFTFLISYLTPVAYYDKGAGVYYRTSKWWSGTTEQHIRNWQTDIWNSPDWKANPAAQEKSEWSGNMIVRYPRFEKKPQKEISKLFHTLMKTMKMDRKEKARLYHVDPQMRQGSYAAANYAGGHLKHHDTEEEGLPLNLGQLTKSGVPGEFFQDFKPDMPEFYDWGSDYGRRDNTPYEPDERGRRPKRKKDE